MGNEAAAMAQGAEQSGEIIHYAATEIAPGIVINMQTMYMTWIAMAIVFVLFFVVSRNPKLVPSGLQNVMEMFMFILISNEIGMLPQIGVHWTSPTNDINTCFALSLLIALSAYIVGVARQGLKHFKHFVQPAPGFIVLHLLDAVTKPLTMALRLFGNILAGEILLIVLYQLSPWIIPEFWVMFSLFIGFVQAFIFTILALGSYALAFSDHEH